MPGPNPARYSRFRYLFASGTLVICLPAASYFNKRPALNEAAYKLTASVRNSASLKLPGYCFPLLQESANKVKALTILSGSLGCVGWEAGFFCESRRGFCILNPASILSLSPTNIIPSAGNSSLFSINSAGSCGLMPPSYQHRSTAGPGAVGRVFKPDRTGA